jgi:hypothetical protein
MSKDLIAILNKAKATNKKEIRGIDREITRIKKSGTTFKSFAQVDKILKNVYYDLRIWDRWGGPTNNDEVPNIRYHLVVRDGIAEIFYSIEGEMENPLNSDDFEDYLNKKEPALLNYHLNDFKEKQYTTVFDDANLANVLSDHLTAKEIEHYVYSFEGGSLSIHLISKVERADLLRLTKVFPKPKRKGKPK